MLNMIWKEKVIINALKYLIQSCKSSLVINNIYIHILYINLSDIKLIIFLATCKAFI